MPLSRCPTRIVVPHCSVQAFTPQGTPELTTLRSEFHCDQPVQGGQFVLRVREQVDQFDGFGPITNDVGSRSFTNGETSGAYTPAVGDPVAGTGIRYSIATVAVGLIISDDFSQVVTLPVSVSPAVVFNG